MITDQDIFITDRFDSVMSGLIKNIAPVQIKNLDAVYYAELSGFKMYQESDVFQFLSDLIIS